MDPIIRKIMSLKKDIMKNNIAIKKEKNQGGGIVLPIKKINPMEKNIIEHKKIQESQNKIKEQKNNIELTKGVIPDPNKRQFIKKGILGIIMGVGIAIFSKITRSVENINFNDGTVALDLETAGNIIKPNQPCFLLGDSTIAFNVTGDGTGYTIVYETETFDLGGDCTTTTFTAPVTGRYLLTVQPSPNDSLTASHTYATYGIVTSNRNYYYTVNPYPTKPTGAYQNRTVTVIADMDAADTAHTIIAVSNDTKVVDVGGNAAYGWFSGCLIS